MKNIAWTFIATLALACACAGQETGDSRTEIRPFATLSITGTGGLGYKNPDIGTATGVELSGPYWLALTSFNLEAARKIETGDGFELASSDLGFLRYRGLLAGGGARWVRQQTSKWNKSALRPEIAAGYERAPVRLIGRYILAGSDRNNGLRGVGADITYTMSRHWRLQGSFETLSFYPTGFPSQPRLRGQSMSFGVTLIK